MPKNVSAQPSEDVTLKCSIKGQKGEVTWCKDDSFCTFGRRRNFSDPRLTLIGEEAKGFYIFLIKKKVPITINADFAFNCFS